MLILDALDQNDIYEVNEDLTSVSNQFRRQNRIAQICRNKNQYLHEND